MTSTNNKMTDALEKRIIVLTQEIRFSHLVYILFVIPIFIEIPSKHFLKFFNQRSSRKLILDLI